MFFHSDIRVCVRAFMYRIITPKRIRRQKKEHFVGARWKGKKMCGIIVKMTVKKGSKTGHESN